ncbi:hypothetical protein [Deinococcus soli (ex Cha et al. 2016)]|uniref:Uncharacterized protein n=2 Tax=Deinococcus soli (ex Cha et al. 2016) TaxID=1309411 RepID=A0ACC6KKL9_9DEIO|nr:hypothetical protein [Deinococcus soli (ex Cha et al. 2016)]MDR6218591.1 hypothetical protein [Deinococcus soli (ex Cha et al. 2016)]MDR6328388.1 hypothetical protein [Deinococcus soli (ex Cha et al. 2016)]MDR6752999.1 hypothetical protein [Deinococcus soli (ex Cha et al. 2016)]
MNTTEFLDALQNDPAFAAQVAAALTPHLRVNVHISARTPQAWDGGSEPEFEADAELHAVPHHGARP